MLNVSMLNVHFFKYKVLTELKNVFLCGSVCIKLFIQHYFSLKYDLIKPAFCPPCPKTCRHFVRLCKFDRHFVHRHFVRAPNLTPNSSDKTQGNIQIR